MMISFQKRRILVSIPYLHLRVVTIKACQGKRNTRIQIRNFIFFMQQSILWYDIFSIYLRKTRPIVNWDSDSYLDIY